MEHLQYRFEGGRPADPSALPSIVGVVASGNLEVLIEPVPQGCVCAV